jgi:predicted metalloendopeptidase
MKNISLILVVALSIFSCNTAQKEATETVQENIGLNLTLMDTTIKPQDDFYNYVNGQWMKTAAIPADRSRWGSFDELRKNTDVNTLQILDEAIKSDKYKAGTDQRKAIDYFASILDTVSRAKEDIAPVKPYLDEIDKIDSKQGVLDFMTKYEPVLSSAFFGVGVHADMKDSNKNVLYVFPAGTGLPDRDYYLADDADSKKIREQYKEHIGKMLHFITTDESAIADAQDNILALETQLAKAKLTKEERRKPENTYNPMSVEDLQKMMPDIAITKYLKDLQLEVTILVNSQPEYLKEVNKIFKENSLDQIKDYLSWTVFNGAAGQLSPEISDTGWEFYGKTLDGQKERRPLKERALATINWSIGEAVGKLYVEKMFPPEAKEKAKEMVNYLQQAYKKRIDDLSWMSAETKVKAKEKVAGLQIKIGYPDKWKDYSTLVIKSTQEGGNYFSNSMNVSRWRFEEQLAKLKKPVDKTEWGMAPQIVNAYYNPSYNEIVFPAAILQPPFYDYRADEAVNYGGMGAVIGHEISHGFDDQGAKFNVAGNFENWWTDADFEAFNKLGKQLSNQFSAIEVLPEVFVNGEFTLGENIGDLGGTNSAFTALQLYFKDHNKPEKIQGFTPEQRFFMSWATIWRTKSRDEALKKQIKTDPHSPGQVRATQPLKNIDAFYKAFEIKEGDAMYINPEERVKIW